MPQGGRVERGKGQRGKGWEREGKGIEEGMGKCSMFTCLGDAVSFCSFAPRSEDVERDLERFSAISESFFGYSCILELDFLEFSDFFGVSDFLGVPDVLLGSFFFGVSGFLNLWSFLFSRLSRRAAMVLFARLVVGLDAVAGW